MAKIISIINPKIYIVSFVFALLLGLFFYVPTANAATRSDCKKSDNQNKCEQDFENCNDLLRKPGMTNNDVNDCQNRVIDDYTRNNSKKDKGNNNGGNNQNGRGGGDDSDGGSGLSPEDKKNGYVDVCGADNLAVKVKFDFGCQGEKLPNQFKNPIYDLAFSLIRFLSAGVGVVVVIAIILAGIKYSTAEGNPEETMKAKSNIQAALIALLIYIFTFSIIQWLVPGGVFN